MKEISIEKLKEMLFPVQNVALRGDCIVVPGDKFDPDWEDQLCAQGHKVFMQSLGGKVVTLVKLEEDKKDLAASRVANLQVRVWSEDDVEMLLKRMREVPGTVEQKCVQLVKEFEGRSSAAIYQKYVKLQRGLKKQAGSGEEEVVYAPLESQSDNVTKSPQEQAGLQRVLKGKDTPLGPRWTEDEYKLLIKLWNEHKKVCEIAAEFPGRSGHAVASALARLKQSGAIKGRWAQKKNRFSKVGKDRVVGAESPTPSGEKTILKESPTPPAPSTPTDAPIINTSLTIQLNVNCNDGKAVANFLKIIEKMRLRK
jgi:hypothetical protein